MLQAPITKHTFDLEDRTLEFSKTVIQLCKKVPRNATNIELISQLVRSSGSVGANYREANDALSKKDFTHRILITRREAKEAYYWLQLLKEENSSLACDIDKALQEAMQLKKIFSAIAGKVS
ncbi:MAG: four helix bundle protein [Candidatus Omnitrophica bacterium]|jgi:four helix bundle protein|nr:four helix bundle protein [Candidatus Omnitrophota bacterium]